MYRTHNCGSLCLKNIGEKVTLSGWIQKIRDLGSIIFIDLRDYYGITQLTIYKDNIFKKKTCKLGREFVIQIDGNVVERKSKNLTNSTGEIEVHISKLHILNTSLIPPFTIEDKTDGGEEIRMKYRYLDIRRNLIKNKLTYRHKIALIIREYLSKKEFIEIETPFLIKSTSEGARDFIIPSRINPGKFYALPQSPQFFKQLLIIGGIDKYFQIVKCFRDEDFRTDRQLEFTQIDCEMAFINQENILNTFETFICYIFKNIRGINLKRPWPRISYNQALQQYGSDKPDIRFNIILEELTDFFKNKNIAIFNNQNIIGITAPNCAKYNHKQINDLIESIKQPKIKLEELIWVKCLFNNKFQSSIDGILTEEDFKNLSNRLKAKVGDLLLILFGDILKIRKQLGFLRLKIAQELKLIDSNQFAPLWIIDFPLLKWDKENKRYHSIHHPFTAPKEEDIKLLRNFPEKVRSKAYDIVINGQEIGGGSIRIHERKLQEMIFKYLGFSKKESLNKFGFLMEALEYGAPPHGGIAIGFDRLVAILMGEENIKDFIAFPKNNSGKDIMMDSPSLINFEQLKELYIKIENI